VGPANANEIAAALVRCTIKLWPACQPGRPKYQVTGGKSAIANKADARSKATPSDTIRSERNAISLRFRMELLFDSLLLLFQVRTH